jgi:hypothetical protein
MEWEKNQGPWMPLGIPALTENALHYNLKVSKVDTSKE